MSSDAPTLVVEVEETGPCSRRLRITVPASRVDSEIAETFDNVMRTVQFRGFRRGKAPMRLVRARLGDRVLEEVRERLVEAAIDEAIRQESLKPVGNGSLESEEVQVVEGQDLEFAIALDVKPQFELPSLGELTVTRPRMDAGAGRATTRSRGCWHCSPTRWWRMPLLRIEAAGRSSGVSASASLTATVSTSKSSWLRP